MVSPMILKVKGTSFYLIDCIGGKLLIDAGWELERFQAEMKTKKLSITQIRWVMYTHHHPDHAGLVQAIRDLGGAKLIIHSVQIPYLDALRGYAARMPDVRPIRLEQGDLIDPDRSALAALGVRGEIVPTPGHSPDSVSLLLEDGTAFIGDLTSPDMASIEDQETVWNSWQTLIDRGARAFYPSHAEMITVETARELLHQSRQD